MRGIVFGLFLFVAAASCFAQGRRHRTVTRTPRQRVFRKQGAPGITRAPHWVTIDMWTGMGKKTTEAFSVNGKWRISYSYTAGGSNRNLMEIVVMHPGSNDLKQVAVRLKNQEGTSDVAYVNKAGRYNLAINCSNVDWTVSVEELRS